MSIINLNKSDIYQNTEFHFAKGSIALDEWMKLQLSEALIEELYRLVLDYPTFAVMELDSELEQARELIFQVISYCDVHARDKKKYNQYSDSRVLAKAGVRMGPWTKHLFNYKYRPQETNISVRYALDMLRDPQNNINILSVDHRNYVSTYYLKEAYDEATFVNKLKSKFVDETFADIPNQDNIMSILAHHIYSEKHLWYPQFKSFKDLKGAIERHIGDNQLDYTLGANNPNSFYWIGDIEGFFDTIDAHYEFFKTKPREGNVISIDLHFEGTLSQNQELLDIIGDLPDYLMYKRWGKSNCISHVREFTLESPDLLDNMFECLDELYDYTYPLLIDTLKKRFPSKTLEMNLNHNEKKAVKLLQYKGQIILQGPPGTGKTRAAKRIAESMLNIEGHKVVTKPSTIDLDTLKSLIPLGLKFKSVSNYSEYEIMGFSDNVFFVKTHKTGKEYPASFERIMDYYKDDKWSKSGVIKLGNDSYEAAIAKYIHDNIEFKESIETIENTDRLRILQFHPSYTYEDFVRGISTDINGASISYRAKDRILIEMANKAILSPDKKYVLIIDEINRANLSSVLGELIYALEYRGKKVESMYGIENSYDISLPDNLYIIGTMNTADRSVGHIDYAIRRRFAFVDVHPEKLTDTDKIWFNTQGYEKVEKLFTRTNVSNEFDVKDIQLGHSYFIVNKEKNNDSITRDELFAMKMNYEIKPILLEYVKDGILIGKIGTQDVTEYIEEL